MCVGTPINCDDNNPCTVDSCIPNVGCNSTPGNAGTECRASTGQCDVAELCTGTSAACPEDVFRTTDALHGNSQGGAATTTQPITARGRATPAWTSSSASTSRAARRRASATWRRPARGRRARARRTASQPRRRAARGRRRRRVRRDGRSLQRDEQHLRRRLPARARSRAVRRRASATSRRPARGRRARARRTASQSATTSCTGTSNGGACDGTDHCTGHGNTCVDVFQPRARSRAARRRASATWRRPARVVGRVPGGRLRSRRRRRCTGTSNGGACDESADHCSGTAQRLRGRASSQRARSRAARGAGQCDVAETCTGTSGACPADGFEPAATTVHGDVEGRCVRRRPITAAGPATPAWTSSSASTVTCRAAAGQCDVAETCTGSSGACPADGFAPAATMPARERRTAARATRRPITAAGRQHLRGRLPARARRVPRRTRASATSRRPARGSSGACPADGFEPAATTARDVERRRVRRDGRSLQRDERHLRRRLPARARVAVPRMRASATSRRSARGSSGACPADVFASAATLCTGTSTRRRVRRTRPITAAGTGNTCVDVFQREHGHVPRATRASATSRRPARGRRARARRTSSSRRRRCAPGRSNGGACDAADHCRGTQQRCVDVFQREHGHVPRGRRASATSPRSARDRRARARRTSSRRRRRVHGIVATAARATTTRPITAAGTRNTCVDVFQREHGHVPRRRRTSATSRRPARDSSGVVPGGRVRAGGDGCARERRRRRLRRAQPITAAGRSNTCVDVVPARARSRAARTAGQCDVAETCTGTSGACPTDVFESAATLCTGTSQRRRVRQRRGRSLQRDAQHLRGRLPARARHVPRRDAGQCDVAETCTGSSGACPADVFEPARRLHGHVEGGACDDAADHCSGTAARVWTSSSRHVHVPADAGTCDVAETCTGIVGRLPGGRLRVGGNAVCDGIFASGVCDNDAADHCTGTSRTPVSTCSARPVTCRADAGQCDVAEMCTGTRGRARRRVRVGRDDLRRSELCGLQCGRHLRRGRKLHRPKEGERHGVRR